MPCARGKSCSIVISQAMMYNISGSEPQSTSSRQWHAAISERSGREVGLTVKNDQHGPPQMENRHKQWPSPSHENQRASYDTAGRKTSPLQRLVIVPYDR